MKKESSYTLDDLEKYRREDGYIDMDLFLLENPIQTSREFVGTIDRQKDWVKLNDEERILLKTEPISQDVSQNGMTYASLIYNKLAAQAGIKTAHEDLIIYKGNKGILSKDVKSKGETFRTLRDYIGDDISSTQGYEDIIDVEYVHENLFEALKNSTISSENIKKVISDFNKAMVFDLFAMSTDNHSENYAFVESIDQDGNKIIQMASIFDRENSLVLDVPFDSMEKISKDVLKVADIVKMQDPKIGIVPLEEENSSSYNDFFLSLKSQVNDNDISLWEDTLEYLSEFSHAKDFIVDKCMNLDIRKAILDVEKDVGCELPRCIKDMSTKCFEERKEQIAYFLGLDIDYSEKETNEKNQLETKQNTQKDRDNNIDIV